MIEAVVRALSNPEIEITAERIAAEAGVSLSTLFRHFGDLDGMSEAVTAHVRGQVAPILLRGPFEGDLADRVADLVDRRAEAAEIVRPLRRAVLRSARPLPKDRERDRETRAQLREQMRAAFAPELEGASPELIAALDALLSFETFDHLRVHQGLPLEGTKRSIAQAVRSLLAET